MDIASWDKWVDYSIARDVMLEHTHTEWAPWNIVNANVKRNARLNVIRHLLETVPYEKLPPKKVKLPKRPPIGDYQPPKEILELLIEDHYG